MAYSPKTIEELRKYAAVQSALKRGGRFAGAHDANITGSEPNLLELEALSDRADDSERPSGIALMRRFLRRCRAYMDLETFHAMVDALASNDSELAGDDLPTYRKDGMPNNAIGANDVAMDTVVDVNHVKDEHGNAPMARRPRRVPRYDEAAYKSAIETVPELARIKTWS